MDGVVSAWLLSWPALSLSNGPVGLIAFIVPRLDAARNADTSARRRRFVFVGRHRCESSSNPQFPV